MKYLSPTKTAPPKIPKLGQEDPPTNGGKPPRNKQFERGIADLAIEARFLTLLSHRNIISLHYVAEGSLEEQFNCGEGDDENDDDVRGSSRGDEERYRHQFGYFLLLDPLFETLARRIDGTYVPRIFDCPTTAQNQSSSRWWKRMMHKNHNHHHLANNNNGISLEYWKLQLAQRLDCLRGIASALQYLHDDCRVIYRDVKVRKK